MGGGSCQFITIYYSFLRGGGSGKYITILNSFLDLVEGKVCIILIKLPLSRLRKKMFLKTEEFDKKCYSKVLILRINHFFGMIVFHLRQNNTVLQSLGGGGLANILQYITWGGGTVHCYAN